MQTWTERARAWMAQDPDPETRAELAALVEAGDEAALAERFDGALAFGTAGIRGVLGAGPLRMNRVVVRRVSAGVAAWYDGRLPDARTRGVVIGYDGRKNSRVFAEDAAGVFLGAGWRVWLAPEPVPTPLVAFVAKDLGAAVGVVVTASHNPPEYNGYKVYGPDAAQIVPPDDRGIAEAIEGAPSADAPPMLDLDAAQAHGRLKPIEEAAFERYLQGIRAMAVDPAAARRALVRVAYTPLHGVGGPLAEAVLRQAGFDDLHVVEAQAEPDPSFPTVRFPNPEEPGAMDRVIALAEEVGADLAVANDPDADRLAVALPRDGGWQMLTGDQIGQLLAGYLLEHGRGGTAVDRGSAARGRVGATVAPGGAAGGQDGVAGDARVVATSLVSSRLLGRMAAAAGAEYVETLTGFKWILHGAMDAAERVGGRIVFSYEEALGYCVGELVRDKDGLGALALMVELAAVAKSEGRTLWDRLEDLYRAHGLHLTRQHSRVLPGADGLARMQALMAGVRAAPPAEVGGRVVARFEDLLEATEPSRRGNVLVLHLEDGSRVIMRPSGTEPKLKSYYEVRIEVAPEEPFEEAAARARTALDDLVAAHQALLQD